MGQLQFDHLELTFPRGALTREFRDEIDAFWGGVFGFSSKEHVVAGRSCHMLRPREDHQFILLAEAEPGPPMELPAQDVHGTDDGYVFVPHLGILYDSDEDVDRLLAASLRFQERDARVEVKDYPLYEWGGRRHHNFLVRYLLPIWFDVHWSSDA